MNSIGNKIRSLLPLLVILTFTGIRAQENAIIYTIANDMQVSSNQFEFDLFLFDPDPAQPFQLCTVQAGIYVNPQMYAGGTVNAQIIEGTSNFNASQVPTSITFTQSANIIKLASKAPPGCGAGTIISQDPNNRTRICRIRLTNTAAFTTCSAANLTFCFTTTPYPTKLSYYPPDCIQVALNLNPANCFSTAINQPLNSGIPAPIAYDVAGGGSYCAGEPGLPVGLSGSEQNVTYTLYKDGVALVPTITGTGSAISFGLQTAGVYTVIGQRPCGSLSYFTTQMTGTAILTLADPTVPGIVNGPDNAFEGITLVMLNLSGNNGNVLKWQKRLNAGTWTDIANTSSTYSEIATPTGSWEYRAVVQNSNCLIENSTPWTVNVVSRTLTVKMFLQGLYRVSTGLMDKAQDENGDHYPGDIADMVSISLAHNISPFNIEYSIPTAALNRDGSLNIDLPPGSISSYYIVIKHRNSIETWSSFPINLSSNHTNYNFTNGIYKAYGYNMCPMGNVWVLYGGDVNQDGIVDSGDMICIDNDASNFVTGYVPHDANGDGLIDSGDMIMVDNNAGEFIGVIVP